MKTIYCIISDIFFIVFLFSCSERFPLDFVNTQPRIVIEALITDRPGPYYVRISKTTDSLRVPKWINNYYPDPVLNAMVIISSSDGIIDTLKQFHYPVNYIPLPPDSILGYYCSRNWTGKVGVQYYLDVFIESKHYHSEETMLPSLLIDTCIFKFQQGPIGKDNGYLPIVQFKNNGNNSGYFMSTLTLGESRYPSFYMYNSGIYSLFPGNKITDGSIGLYNLADPNFPYLREHSGIGSPWGDTCSILVYSLSRTAYYFHTNLLKQLVNDGGTFKPSPATPDGNISGGAIGIFQVSSVSSYLITKLPKYYE